jgi:hypothetical protein
VGLYGPLSVSGDGVQDIGAVVGPTDIVATLTSPGLVNYLSSVSPRRLGNSGWYGFGFKGGGTGGAGSNYITWWKFLEFEIEDLFPLVNNDTGNVLGDSLFWHCVGGTTFDLIVAWL